MKHCQFYFFLRSQGWKQSYLDWHLLISGFICLIILFVLVYLLYVHCRAPMSIYEMEIGTL